MRKIKYLNKIIGSCALILCMVALLFTFAGATDSNSAIECATLNSYSKDNLDALIDEWEANDYLYAGLFKVGTTEENLTKANMVWSPVEGTEYVAKFVPEGVMGLKAQVSGALLEDENLENSSIRFVTSVDSLVYKEVGFSIKRTLADGTEQELVAENSITKYVYTELYAVDEAGGEVITYKPSDMHACSTYFKTYTVTLVPDNHYNTDLTVTPYWVTFDGVKVEGSVGIKTVNLGRSWFYVDSDSTEEELGTFDEPFKTIENALAYQSEVDRTVLVKESYEIAKSIEIDENVTLTSANMDASVNAPDPEAMATIQSAIAQADSTDTQQMFHVASGTTKVKVIQMAGSGAEAVRAISVDEGATLKVTDAELTGSDNDIYSAGTLSLDGTAYAGAVQLATADTNTIELADTFEGKMVTVSQEDIDSGEMSDVQANKVTNVILPDYVEETQVLTGNADVLENKHEAFEVTNIEPVYIGSTGVLDPCVARIPTDTTDVYSHYSTLQKAVMAVPKDGTETRIEVIRDITMDKAVSIPQNTDRNILLTDDGTVRTLTRNFTGDRMLILRKGNELTVQGSSEDDTNPTFVLDGGKTAAAGTQQIIAVGASSTNPGGTLNLKAGAKLTNNVNNAGGGAIIVYGTFSMDGGIIDGNESAGDNGGAIFVQATGSMFMSGGTISNNKCSSVDSSDELNKDGGAIYIVAGGNLSMDGGTIVGNTAKSGGAILAGPSDEDTGATVVMTGGTISNNTAAVKGGAVFVHANAEFSMTGGTISENSSDKGGGAIYSYINEEEYGNGLHSGKGYVNLAGGTIADNTTVGDSSVTFGGGALCVEGMANIVDGVIIEGNETTQGNGGAVYITTTGVVYVEGGTIRDNTGEYGGAIYLNGNSSEQGNLNILGGTISGNTATENGGGVYVQSYASLNISDGTISGNTATGNGGGVCLYGDAEEEVDTGKGSLNMSGGTIEGNASDGTGNDVHAAGPLSMEGNASIEKLYLTTDQQIYLTAALTSREAITELRMGGYSVGKQVIGGNTTTVANCYVYFETPESSCVYIDSTGCLVTLDVVKNNVARIENSEESYTYYTSLANAISAVPTTGVQTRVELLKSVTLTAAIDIPASGNRNILLTDAGNGNHTIKRNFGGAQMIILRKGNQLTIEGTSKDDTEPSLILDGAEYATAGSQQLILVGTSTSNWDATLTLNSGVALQNNNGTGGGGAMLVYGHVAMNGGLIDNNESTGDNGGGIYIQSTGSMTMTGGTISNNKCSSVNSSSNLNKDGGAIYIVAGGSFDMQGGTIKGNSAQAGSAILTYGAVTMSGGTISGHTSRTNGGAIFVHVGGSFNMSDGKISGNTSGNNGGAIYLHKNTSGVSTMTMSGGTISGNKANGSDGAGGIMVLAGCDLTLTGGTISGNTAKAGAGILTYGTVTMSNATISNNTATGGGGGIFVHCTGVVNMTSGTITGNNANNGGGVYLHRNTTGAGSMNVTGGSITGNTATLAGGGVYILHAANVFTYEDGTVYDNTASTAGTENIYNP